MRPELVEREWRANKYRLAVLREAQEICEEVGYKSIDRCIKFVKTQQVKLAQMRA